MTTTFPPAPYLHPYLTSYEPIEFRGHRVIESAATDVEPMVGDPDITWDALRPLLEQIEAGTHAYFARVARIEFIWDEESTPESRNMRGAVLFDATGAVIVHVSNALLGYWGSGPTLSQEILSALGVPRKLFSDMQSKTRDKRPYLMVLSREKPSESADAEGLIVTHDEPLRKSWEGWQVQ